ERFNFFERSWSPANETQQKLSAIPIDALMAKVTSRLARLAGIRDWAARKIKRASLPIENRFNLVRRLRGGGISERMDRGHHLDLGIPAHLPNELIEQPGIDQRFVTLNVEDKRNATQFGRDLSNSIGPAFVIRTCQANFSAPIKRCLGDPHIVRRDDDRIERTRAPHAFPDMLQERFARNSMQRFARKTSRTPARRNNADRL